MAAYDYRCRVCERLFTVERPMSAVTTLVRCPDGHEEVGRVWSAVNVGGRASAPASSAAQTRASAPAAGCCGGGCCG